MLGRFRSHACRPTVHFPHLCSALVRPKIASSSQHFRCPETAQQSGESAAGSIIPRAAVHPAGAQREQRREPACVIQRSKSMTKPSETECHRRSRKFPRWCFATLLLDTAAGGGGRGAHKQFTIQIAIRQVQKKTALDGRTGGPTVQREFAGEKTQWLRLERTHPHSFGRRFSFWMRVTCPGSRAFAPSQFPIPSWSRSTPQYSDSNRPNGRRK